MKIIQLIALCRWGRDERVGHVEIVLTPLFDDKAQDAALVVIGRTKGAMSPAIEEIILPILHL